MGEACRTKRASTIWPSSAAASMACGIARDAAGRGLKVVLAEQGDLAGATSSASTKLIHGGLRYLEHYEFRLVREALIEREVLLQAAPHIIWPLRFVLPHHRGLRPWPVLRLGLFLYDHLGGRKILPATRTVDLTRDETGIPLKPRLHARLRIFGLLGRGCAPRRPQRARCRRSRRRYQDAHTLRLGAPRRRAAGPVTLEDAQRRQERGQIASSSSIPAARG